MNDVKKSTILGPNAQPVILDEDLGLAVFGGQELRYFKGAGRAQTPTTPQAIVEMVSAHDLVVHSLMREIVNLRERINVLESCDDDQDSVLV